MGRLMVHPHACAALDNGRSRCPRLSARNESALAVEMCWWLHRSYGSAAFDACSTWVPASTGGASARAGGGAEAPRRLLLEYKRIGFGAAGTLFAGQQILYSHTLNLSERDARSLFLSPTGGMRAAAHGRGAHKAHGSMHGSTRRSAVGVGSSTSSSSSGGLLSG
jgi:hypothetical protein